MVAVTNPRHSLPTLRPSGRHLSLVPLEDPLVTVRRRRRVYRRRRLVAALVVAGLAVAVWTGLGALGGALTASGRSVPGSGTPASAQAQAVDVAPGDTFWSIARRLQPDGDVRPLVDHLVRAHGGPVLQVGEKIAVPSLR